MEDRMEDAKAEARRIDLKHYAKPNCKTCYGAGTVRVVFPALALRPCSCVARKVRKLAKAAAAEGQVAGE